MKVFIHVCFMVALGLGSTSFGQVPNPSTLEQLEAQTRNLQGNARIQALLDYSQALHTSGDPKSLETAREALALLPSADIQLEARVLTQYLTVCLDYSELKKAKGALPRAHSVLNRLSGQGSVELSLLAGQVYTLSGAYEQGAPLIKHVIAATADSALVAKAREILADNLRYQGHYPAALRARLNALRYYESRGDSLKIVENLLGLGIIELMTQKVAAAKVHFSEAISWYEASGDSAGLGVAETALSLAYFQEDSLDASLRHGFRSFKIREALEDTRGLGESLNNLALIYMRKKNWQQARDYMETSLDKLEQAEDYRQLPVLLTNLGVCYQELGETARAEAYYQEAISRAKTMGADRARSEAYLKLSRLYANQGDFARAYDFSKRFQALHDTLANAARDRTIQELTEQYALEKEKIQNAKLKLQLATRKKEKYGMIIIGGLLALIAVLVISRQRSRIRQTKVLHAREREALEAREALAQRELEHTKETLARKQESLEGYMQRVLQKNALIEQLETQIETIEVKDNAAEAERAQRLNELRQMKILTEEDWRSFRHHFEQVYHGYLDRLVQVYPDLTKGERRLFVLLKLNLSTSEMADILGISGDSVKKARYRLRKKLKLTENQPLTQFIQSFR